MKVEYVNPFVTASYTVLETYLGEPPTKGPLAVRPELITTQQCNVVSAISGMAEGHVVYGMSLITADKVASQIKGEPVLTFDQVAASAVGDLGNMITITAMTHLAEVGYLCDLAPPSVVRGTNVKVSTVVAPTVVIPIHTKYGDIELAVCLRGRK